MRLMSSALALAVLSCGLSTSALQLGVRPCRPIPSVRARVVLQSDFERAQQRKAALIGAEEEVAEEEGIDATSPDYEPPTIDFAGSDDELAMVVEVEQLQEPAEPAEPAEAANPVAAFFASAAASASDAVTSAMDDAAAEAQRRADAAAAELEALPGKLQAEAEAKLQYYAGETKALPGKLAEAAQAKADEAAAEIAALPGQATDRAAVRTLSAVESARAKVEAARRKRDALKGQ